MSPQEDTWRFGSLGQPILTSDLEGDEFSASHFDLFIPGEIEPHYLSYGRLSAQPEPDWAMCSIDQ
jgi:hypothetical protein